MVISYVKHHEIDKAKWDRCVEQSNNSRIYAQSFYLDVMSPNWDALISDDYECVMPLTWRKKYTIHYLFQPFFCAQLGIFGNQTNAGIVHHFLKKIPAKFKYWDIYLNPDNHFPNVDFPMYERMNYILNLSDSYENLTSSYSQSHIRNIKRSEKFGNTVKTEIPIAEVIQLAQEQTKSFSPIKQKDYVQFHQVLSKLSAEGKMKSYGVYARNNRLTASAVFIFDHRRAYYILVGNHPDGRTSGASHLLIDRFIKDHSETNLILDFEGSSIASLAFFYKNFGATLEIFPGLKINRLPAISRLFGK